MYQLTLGRFLSRDPLRQDGVEVLYDNNPFGDHLTEMRNLYGYVGNNPVNRVDPSGLYAVDPRPVDPDSGGLLPDDHPDRLRQYERNLMIRRCVAWSARQVGLGWMVGLPDCPCCLVIVNGKPQRPKLGVWQEPTTRLWGYHPGAEWCMRSEALPNGAGQQCCYDKAGILITTGEGAGTPDRYSPDVGGHWREDVHSYDACKEAGMLDVYFQHRPPNQGDCKLLPVHPRGPVPQF